MGGKYIMVEPEVGHFLSLKRRTSWGSLRKLGNYLQGVAFLCGPLISTMAHTLIFFQNSLFL